MILKNIGLKNITISASIIFLSIVTLMPAHALEIRVKKNAAVRDEKVMLGDIAAFNPSDDIRIDRLRKIEVADAPSPGINYRISEQLLLYRIGPYISNTDDINLKVPEYLYVRRTAQTVSTVRRDRTGDISRLP